MRILQLSTHSTLIPDHGGKLRSHHIARVLEQAGFDIRRIAFCFRVPNDLDDPREPIIDVGRLPFWRSERYAAIGPCRHYVADYLATVAALDAPEILAEFDERIRTVDPQIVLLEHPWTWPLLARLKAVQSGSIKVLYSSQNVEVELKRRILNAEGIVPPPGLIEEIETLEQELVCEGAGVIACTPADANVFARWGARRVVVAPNGGVRRMRDHLVDLLPWPLMPHQPYGLVVGSSHPPNISGFMDLIAPALPELGLHHRIVLAGGAGGGVAQALEAKGLMRLAEGRLILLGPVDEFCLDCVIANAHVLLLPIQYGGGSNVKTAEALLSGRPMVATAAAMRGFNEFLDVPGVTVVKDEDGATGFADLLRSMLNSPFEHIRADHPSLSRLLWEATIAPLVELIHEIGCDLRPKITNAMPSMPAAQHVGYET
jgi:hypothetical protein